MKNNVIINTKWKLPNATEWNVDPESAKGLCKLWDTDGSNLLHICFDNITEYDPDVVFDKNAIFLCFLLKMLLFFNETYIQVLINKQCLKL